MIPLSVVGASALLASPYALLAPAMVLEGPLATVLGGSLVTAGRASFWLVWLLAVAADTLTDSVLFFLGRQGAHPRVAPLLRRLGFSDHRRESLQRAAQHQLPRLIGAAKLLDVAAVPTFLAVGLAGVRYRRFLGWIVLCTSVRAFVLVTLGVVAGRQIGALLATPAAALVTALVLCGAFLTALALSKGATRRHRVLSTP